MITENVIFSFNGSVMKGGGKSEKKNSVRVWMKAISCSHFLSDWAFLYNLIHAQEDYLFQRERKWRRIEEENRPERGELPWGDRTM